MTNITSRSKSILGPPAPSNSSRMEVDGRPPRPSSPRGDAQPAVRSGTQLGLQASSQAHSLHVSPSPSQALSQVGTGKSVRGASVGRLKFVSSRFFCS